MTDEASPCSSPRNVPVSGPTSAMRAPLFLHLWVGLLWSGSVSAATRSPIIVLHAWGDPFGAETARHLSDQLDELETLKTTTTALSAAAVVPRAAVEWPDHLVVALDNTSHQVVVVRPKDGTVLSRALDPTQRTTPYAVAVAALELLDLAGEEIGRIEVQTSTPGASLSVAVEGTGVLSYAPGGEGAVPMVGAAAWLALRGSRSRWWGGVGLGTRLLGVHRAEAGGYAIDYERLDFEARFGLGRRYGRFDGLLSADVGGSFVAIETTDLSGVVASREQRVSPSAGLSLEGRLLLGAGFALKASTGLSFVVNRARFLVQGEPVFEEGAIRWTSALGVLWESPE